MYAVVGAVTDCAPVVGATVPFENGSVEVAVDTLEVVDIVCDTVL